jgi:hypothetical protein
MSKAETLELISTNLANNSDIQPSEHRAVEEKLVADIYGEEYHKTTHDLGGNVTIDFTFKKRQGICYVTGTVQNTTQSLISINDTDYIDAGGITNGKYNCIGSLTLNVQKNNNNTLSAENLLINILNDVMIYSGIMSAGQLLNFNGFYKIAE